MTAAQIRRVRARAVKMSIGLSCPRCKAPAGKCCLVTRNRVQARGYRPHRERVRAALVMMIAARAFGGGAGP